MSEMNKVYDPTEIEQRLYDKWQSSGYFHAEVDKNKEPFAIVMPPPNITGQLHMGHALDNALQDCLTRFKRMQGYSALWLPGTDHASIATEVKIIEAMKEEGLSKDDVGREGFLKRAWLWKDEYGGQIVQQLRRLGSSCDWERERFTMDEWGSKAVNKAFVSLYKKGYIYKGDRIINWCPNCMTAISEAEVDHEEIQSSLWHIRYKSEDGTQDVVVATTRPETMLGDTAVAVHPDDERYSGLIGKNMILPLMNRPIRVIADSYVDKDFGTGAVKMTPAHDPNDFEVGERHDLEIIKVLDDEGRINENGGKYAGLDRYEARKQIIKDLEDIDALVEIEDHTLNIGSCYRCGTVIEPIISKQWFVAMNDLAKAPIEGVKTGEIEFIPRRYEKTYLNWMENIRDWCISRQLWWGHRIPAYYCATCGETIVAESMPDVCPSCSGAVFVQDEDVLDTWFSSGLWPFSTLGWPDKTPELDYFYPTTVLVTAYDIIFFWVARMIVFGYEEMGQEPFGKVLIHGLVRDELGRKMSKSLGNGIDPLEIIDQYGADALRFSLLVGNAPGNDMRFQVEKVEASRNFTNKIWNAARFVLMNVESNPDLVANIDDVKLDITDRWMLTRLNDIIKEITQHMSDYDTGLATQKIYDFVWSEFCDWYIEMSKARLYSEDVEQKKAAVSVLCHSLTILLKLLHPFMPFITEEIYQNMPQHEETIMLAEWPTSQDKHNYPQDAKNIDNLMEAVRGIRNIRADMNVPHDVRPNIILVPKENDLAFLEEVSGYWTRLAGIGSAKIQSDKSGISENDVSLITGIAEIFIPLDELVDFEKERERLNKEKEKLEKEIEFTSKKLDNPGFVAKAPKKVIADVKAQHDECKILLEKINERISSLK